jgi:hypothetical protein
MREQALTSCLLFQEGSRETFWNVRVSDCFVLVSALGLEPRTP